MEEINYIKHLNAVFFRFSRDTRLNPTHISLYVALFQLWNMHYFKPEFYLNREEAMSFSKIGSKSTYHRCIKELSLWSYIFYEPSHNPFKGSRIKMFDFGTSSGQAVDSSRTEIGTSSGQAVVSINKHIQTLENNKNLNKRENLKNLIFENSETDGKRNGSVPYQDNLKTSTEKKYNEPL